MSQAPVVRRRGSCELTANHKRLYGLVRRSGQISRADLMRQSSLTFPSVSRLVANLLALGLLKEGFTRRGGMSKPHRPSRRSRARYSLGVHFEGDTATGEFIAALGQSLGAASVPTVSLSDGIGSTLDESGFDRSKIIGVCLSTSGESMSPEELEQLSSALGVSVVAEPAIACSVRAERYFGSGSQLGRFLYFDAQRLELGVVNGHVLAQKGTLEALVSVKREGASATSDVLSGVLKGAAALVQAEAMVVSGLTAEDLAILNRQIVTLPLVPASTQAGDPALAASAVPLDVASASKLLPAPIRPAVT